MPSFIQVPVVLFQEHTEDPTVNPWALWNLLRCGTISEELLLPPLWLLVPPSFVGFGLTQSLSVRVDVQLVLSEGVRVEKVGLDCFP